MPISPEQYQMMLARLNRNATREPLVEEGVSREMALQDDIIALCRRQGWAYIRARPDRASTIGLGINDFTIFAEGILLLLECKIGTGKLSAEQQGWSALVAHNGFTVHVVRSLPEVWAAYRTENEKQKPHL